MIALVAAAFFFPAADVTVREVSSPHFRVVTDLPDAEAKELLSKLETMIGHVSNYWGRPLRKTIDMYVARDLDDWPPDVLERMADAGKASIRGGGGLTMTQRRTLGRRWDSRVVVYATSARGTAQHEAVHAYCGLAFGETGPTWYAEGMAEVGQYWRAEDPAAVHAHDVVIDHLRRSEPKPLEELVALGQQTGDSWQNYASRWALCHLLGFNPNYSARFKPLGLALLANRGATFEDAYGPQSREIEFEYRLFLKHLCRGYRVDLCRWDWAGRIKPVRKSGTRLKVAAARGWQAQPVRLQAGTRYRVVAEGEWLVDDGDLTSADGREDGRGQLVAAIFSDDYTLGAELPLGSDATFTPPFEGQLCLRCRDEWGEIADNRGELKVTITPDAGRQ